MQPAQIAAAVVHAQGGAYQQVDKDVEAQQQLPGLLGEQLDVHRGEQNIDQHPQGNSNSLHDDTAVASAPAGGTVYEDQAVAAGRQTEEEKQQIPFAEKFADGIGDPGQTAHLLSPHDNLSSLPSFFLQVNSRVGKI